MSEQIIRVTPLEWAIAMHESIGGRLFAVRHESKFQAKYVDGRGFDAQEAYFRGTSFGLWQIMGENMRRMGYKGLAREWRLWATDAAVQLDYFRRLWAANCDPGDPTWRNVCAWNVGDAGEDKLTEPTKYWFDVKEWLDRAPSPGPGGLVELRCKG